MMHVGIDAQVLGSQRGGAETYTRNVIRALATLDPEGHYTLLSPRPLQVSQITSLGCVRSVVVPPQLLFGRIPISLPLALFKERIDLLHADFMAPILTPVPLVVSVHNISFEHYPNFFSPEMAAAMHRYVP